MSQLKWPDYFHIETADEYAGKFADSLIVQYDSAIRHKKEFPETSRMVPPVSEQQRQALPGVATMQDLAGLGCQHFFECDITGKTWPEIDRLLVIEVGDYPFKICLEVVEKLYEAMKDHES